MIEVIDKACGIEVIDKACGLEVIDKACGLDVYKNFLTVAILSRSGKKQQQKCYLNYQKHKREMKTLMSVVIPFLLMPPHNLFTTFLR